MRIHVALVVLALVFIGNIVGARPADAAVRSCSSSTAVAKRPTLSAGDRGSCVRVAQRLLLARGYSLGGYGATGNFLSRTKTAVQAFQKAQRLPVTGRVDASTWRALAGSSSSRPSAPTPAPAPASRGYDVSRGPNTSNRAILTFDDCPKSLASFKTTVLAAKNAGIALALFPTGACLRTGRFDAAFARAHGHYVFNHSVSHPNLAKLSYARVLAELSAPGVVTTYGRPPYGATSATVRRAYAAKGMKIWLWNVDTNDWRGKSQSTLVSYVVKNTRPGDTVLMHMQWNGFNPSAILAMKSGLAARGVGLCRNTGPTSVAPGTVRC